jgi:NitT/TauT family transport system substrate-binding protein
MRFFFFFLSSIPIIAVAEPTKVRMALNWQPEAEFGGFYAAQIEGIANSHGVELELIPGGPGIPTIQMVGAGKVDLGISSADQVVISHDRGMDLVALFAVYQTNPQGLMAHSERGFKKIDDILRAPGTLAIIKGHPYYTFLEKKLGFKNVRIVPYSGDIAPFLADPKHSQQCFVTSEPILARRQGKKPQSFLIADAGYNPYTTVLVARKKYIDAHGPLVETLIKIFQAGWRKYLTDPAKTNAHMNRLNPTMDLGTLSESAEIQKPLIENEVTGRLGLGAMTEERWRVLSDQLKDIALVKKISPPKDYFLWKAVVTKANSAGGG